MVINPDFLRYRLTGNILFFVTAPHVSVLRPSSSSSAYIALTKKNSLRVKRYLGKPDLITHAKESGQQMYKLTLLVTHKAYMSVSAKM
jgi:hypothetical protein